MTTVAIAYVMQKVPYVFPLVGGRKVEHLEANIEALSVALSEEHIKFIESILPFDPGFPAAHIVSHMISTRISRLEGLTLRLKGDGTSYNLLHQSSGNYDRWPRAQAIRPAYPSV